MKVIAVGDRVTTGANWPVPVRLTACEPLPALSVTVNVPLRVPEAVGLKVTLMVQGAPAAKEVPQSLVCAKSRPRYPTD